MTAPETVETQIQSDNQLPSENSSGAYVVMDPEGALLNAEFPNTELFNSDQEREAKNFELEIALYEAREGDDSAVAFFLHAVSDIIAKGAVPVGATSVDRQDYIQNANERIFRYLVKRPENYRSDNLSGYIYTTSRNATRDMLRKSTRSPQASLTGDPIENSTSYAESEYNIQAHKGMTDFLLKSGCNNDQITAILLYHAYGYTGEEIANITATNINTIRTRINKGLVKVRKKWGFTADSEDAARTRNLITEELALLA